MVIHSNLASDAGALQNNFTKAAQRTAAADTAAPQTQTAAGEASAVLTAENLPPAGSEIQDPAAADQSLNFLQNSFLNSPALALQAQANQIPASVLQLLQP